MFWELVNKSKRILVTSHSVPDDDSIASVLAVYGMIRKKHPRKTVRIVYSSPIKKRWGQIPNFDKVEASIDTASIISEFDLAIFLDGNYFKRFSSDPRQLAGSRTIKVCIDHHASKADIFDLALIAPKATSTSELVYYALCEQEKRLAPDIAKALLLGLIGDTGRFRFIEPRNAHILSIAERLIKEGGIQVDLFMAGYSSYSKKVFSALKQFINNSELVYPASWPPYIVSFISREQADAQGYSPLDIDSAASLFITTYGTSVNDASWGAVLYPLPDGDVKIGLRSRPGGVNVRLIMEELGIGSGHDRASGGVYKVRPKRPLEPEECYRKFKSWLSKNKPILA